ncbi:MAG: transcription elongation factor GreA [SAR324 cluster bacterium]|nr:transcription elongation factor GreA [SAR324 cluster bacterium]
MSDSYPITKEGHEKLKKELKQLKSVERPAVVKAIEEARAHGDLKENAEYHAAKERQGFIEGRLQEINGKLSNCTVIDPTSLSGDKVVFGATVTLLDLEIDDEYTYKIVGEDEADLAENKISFSSPLGRALIGKNTGDEVTVTIPKGKMDVEILDVEFV